MVGLLKNLVNLPLVDPGSDGLSLVVTVKGNVLKLNDAQLSRIRSGVLSHQRVNLARDAAEKALLAALATQVPEDADLDPDAVAELITDSAAYRDFVDAWWPPLSAPDVLRRLGDPRVTAKVADGILDADEQALLAASYAEGHDWTVADMALLDELVSVLGPEPIEDHGPNLFIEGGENVGEFVTTADRLRRTIENDLTDDRHETYAHVLVDESQDITPMQWRMLRRRGSQASWTIVGDLAQSPGPTWTRWAARCAT